MKYPISAMIVGYNEGKLLPACFESVGFCDEIIYTDLGSTDNSLQVAKKYANKIFERSRVASGEWIQPEIVNHTKHDWVIYIDPDEVVDPTLAKEIQEKFDEIKSNESVGGVQITWQFYFKKHRLSGTPWGGSNHKTFLVNKHRFSFEPVTHYGRRLRPGFIPYIIHLNKFGTNVLHHYWMSSWKVFLAKHRRYLTNEGKDRFNMGVRTTFKSVLLAPYREFKKSFWTLKGYKDGLLGLFLSAFWAWYQTSSLLSLYKIQKRQATQLA